MNQNSLLVAQIGLSVLFVVGFFTILILFMLGYVKVPTDYKEAFAGFLGVLSGQIVNVMAYWFARQRDAVGANVLNVPPTSSGGN